MALKDLTLITACIAAMLAGCDSSPVSSPTTGGSDGDTNTGTPSAETSLLASRACANLPASAMPPDIVEYQHLIGAVHEHSGFSDGEVGSSPIDYFQAARDQGLDFMFSSEHSDNGVLPVTASADCVSERFADCVFVPTPGESATKWELTADIAAGASDENFTAIRGFEWTSDRFGHANIFFSQNDLNAKASDGYAGTMEGLWEWFKLDPALGGGADGLLVFNHPGREDAIQSNIPDPAYTFNDFAYRADVAERVVGVETFGKSSDIYDLENGAPSEGWYAYALDRGWQLAPYGSEDEHGTEWAKGIRAKTLFLANANTPDDLREAMAARRNYSVAQDRSDIRLEWRADGLAMGSEYSPPENTLITLFGIVQAGMPDGGELQVVSNLGEVLLTVSESSLQLQVTVTADYRWYYLRVMDAEGIPVAYSAPVWLQAGADPARCENG